MRRQDRTSSFLISVTPRYGRLLRARRMEEGRFLLFVAVGLRRWALGGGAYILASIPALRAVHAWKKETLPPGIPTERMHTNYRTC